MEIQTDKDRDKPRYTDRQTDRKGCDWSKVSVQFARRKKQKLGIILFSLKYTFLSKALLKTAYAGSRML